MFYVILVVLAGVAGVIWQVLLLEAALLPAAAVPAAMTLVALYALHESRRAANTTHDVSRLKNQFVSIASHELRSPLNGMMWAIQSLLKPSVKNLTEDQRALLHDMYKSTASSVSTINEILDMSIFEQGQQSKLQHNVVELTGIVHEVQKTLRLGAQEKGITFESVGIWPSAAYAYGDTGALKRAFMNVLSNSIKYSHEKSKIEFLYRLENNHHVLVIRDYGIGIPKSEQRRVLEGYYRAPNATKVQAHGTGLGLWVTRLIAEQHKGYLRLVSDEDKGTTVYVAIPVAKDAHQKLKLTAGR